MPNRCYINFQVYTQELLRWSPAQEQHMQPITAQGLCHDGEEEITTERQHSGKYGDGIASRM